MGQRYQHIAFGDESVRRQREVGSIVAYGQGLSTPDAGPQEVSAREVALLTGAFQFHLGSVTPSGWPYLQYRSGPRGFLHHLGGNRFGFADFHGNQQFVTLGNIEHDPRVTLFVADFPRRLRLKLYGRAHEVGAEADPDLLEELRNVPDGLVAARTERSIVIDVEAFDWNCSRSLVPQYTEKQVRDRVAAYAGTIERLEAQVATLTAQLAATERREP